eukprot:354903-Chlamydomonas_euryale.AAC.13
MKSAQRQRRNKAKYGLKNRAEPMELAPIWWPTRYYGSTIRTPITHDVWCRMVEQAAWMMPGDEPQRQLQRGESAV